MPGDIPEPGLGAEWGAVAEQAAPSMVTPPAVTVLPPPPSTDELPRVVWEQLKTVYNGSTTQRNPATHSFIVNLQRHSVQC